MDRAKQMREKVLSELKHIPDWPQPQKELRMAYWMRRMHSLGKKMKMRKTAKEILEESINGLRESYPDFSFQYDQEFFDKNNQSTM